MPRPVSLIIITLLALAQGILGVLRSFAWFQAGTDISGRGFLVSRLAADVLYFRGGLIAVIALLYFLFAIGALMGQAWSWWVGLVAALINFVLVMSSISQAEDILLALPWIVVPLVLVWYLFSPAGRLALRR
jgi:hypothetical protein